MTNQGPDDTVAKINHQTLGIEPGPTVKDFILPSAAKKHFLQTVAETEPGNPPKVSITPIPDGDVAPITTDTIGIRHTMSSKDLIDSSGGPLVQSSGSNVSEIRPGALIAPSVLNQTASSPATTITNAIEEAEQSLFKDAASLSPPPRRGR